MRYDSPSKCSPEEDFCLFFFFHISRLGAHYRSSTVGTEQDFTITKVISHENYKKPIGLAHDIAMLKLNKPAQINREVDLACLPASSDDLTEIDGKHCWVTGIVPFVTH